MERLIQESVTELSGITIAMMGLAFVLLVGLIALLINGRSGRRPGKGYQREYRKRQPMEGEDSNQEPADSSMVNDEVQTQPNSSSSMAWLDEVGESKLAVSVVEKTLSEKYECIACESRDVEELGKDAYRCRACGYEGGDGYAAYQRGLARKAFETWPLDKRKDEAIKDLKEAKGLLLSAQGYAAELDITVNATEEDSGDRSNLLTAMESAERFYLEAQLLVSRAGNKLGRPDLGAFDYVDGLEQEATENIKEHYTMLSGVTGSRDRSSELNFGMELAMSSLTELIAFVSEHTPEDLIHEKIPGPRERRD